MTVTSAGEVHRQTWWDPMPSPCISAAVADLT
jgi:hypothetical protein